jgi:CheY-like chemotaxis protein
MTPSPASPAQGGHETILVVEDEDIVRRVVVRRLENAGYRVLQAKNGAEGLDVATQNIREIKLVITDVVMPEMNGREMVSRLHESSAPGLAVLFMSGYPKDIVTNRGVLDPAIDFLEKPRLAKELLPKVREILDRPPHRPQQLTA